MGSLLKEELLARGDKVVSVDLRKDDCRNPGFTGVRGDIRDEKQLAKLGERYRFSAVFHLAAEMPHAVKNKRDFWRTNVNGTLNVCEMAKNCGTKRVIFTSSNCIYGQSFDRPVRESDCPNPCEIYGRSKAEGEKILARHYKHFKSLIFRCPPVIDEGRAGNIAILFDFIRENRKLWLVGKGDNRYQLLYAKDLIDAMLRSLHYGKSNTFGIGSDRVPTLRETYEYLIEKAASSGRPACFPAVVIRPAMRAAKSLGLSPLGVYFQNMIDKDFAFDTARLKKELGWHPTLNNSEMLYKSYAYYVSHIDRIKTGGANNTKAKMGILRLLKWLS